MKTRWRGRSYLSNAPIKRSHCKSLALRQALCKRHRKRTALSRTKKSIGFRHRTRTTSYITMKQIAWIIYIPLQIIWLPISILGAAWVGYKQIWRSKQLGLSQTAVEIINGRWTAHIFGLRDDLAAKRLAGALPNNSIFGLRLTLFPLMVARRIAGQPILYPVLPDDDQAGIASLVFSRSARIDGLIDAYAEQATQFVVLGAGLDTRAYGPLKTCGMAMFELDQATVQRSKCDALERAGLSRDHVHYIEVDFTRPNWSDALMTSAYDPGQKTIFLWEGVTLYLSAAVIDATLKTIRSIAAPGSVLIADFYGDRVLAMANKAGMKQALSATDEQIEFGLNLKEAPDKALSELADANGYQLASYYPLGAAHRKGAFMVIAALDVRDTTS